jgi:hypothetical protein
MTYEINTEKDAENKRNHDATSNEVSVHVQCVTSVTKDHGWVVKISSRRRM